MEGHIHPPQPGNPNAGTPPTHPRIPVRPPPRPPARPPVAPRPIPPKPKPTVKPRAPKPPPTIAQPKRTHPPAPPPPRRVTFKPRIPLITDVFQPTDWVPNRIDPTEDPFQDRDIQSTQLTTVFLRGSVPSFTQSLPLIAVSVGIGVFLVVLVVMVAWVIRCISRVNTPEYIQKKAMILHQQSDSIRLATGKESSKEPQRDSVTSNRSKRSGGSTCISPATPEDSPLPSPTPSSPSASTTSECSAFPGFTPTPSEKQYQWLPMHRYEDIIEGESNKEGKQAKVAGEELYQNAPLNNRNTKENPLRTIAQELEAQFRKQGVTLFKKHQNQNVKNHEYVNKNVASNQNTYVCRSETDWVENSIYETGSVANNTKNYEIFYRVPSL